MAFPEMKLHPLTRNLDMVSYTTILTFTCLAGKFELAKRAMKLM